MKKELKDLELDSLNRVHILGVGGTLMGSFAAFLKRRGIEVSGSDGKIYPPMSDVLASAGVKIFEGYSSENLKSLNPAPELVVVGNVIRKDNPEAIEALSGDYCYGSLPEVMKNLFLQETRNLVVSGTHGKTTTSSLLAFVLEKIGKSPSFFIGGVSHDLPHSFQVQSLEKGNFFVLEGDEYDTAFWDKVPKFNHYLPDDVILTSVEFDHADIYSGMDQILEAFSGLIKRIRSGGRLIACVDYPYVRELIRNTSIPVITYSHGESGVDSRFKLGPVRNTGSLFEFDVIEGNQKIDEIKIQMSGRYNRLNALAVWIECRELGIPSEEIKKALALFRGVKRRQEIRGEEKGVLVIDDFAHHPTAVKETLEGLRSKYPERRLIAVFEPRSATSRRNIFQKEYARAFLEADVIYISRPFDQSRIAENERFSSDQLVRDLEAEGKTSHVIPSVDEGVHDLAQFATKGDVVAVLSNGGFDGFIPKLLKKLGNS